MPDGGLFRECQHLTLGRLAFGARTRIYEHVGCHDGQPFVRVVKAARQCFRLTEAGTGCHAPRRNRAGSSQKAMACIVHPFWGKRSIKVSRLSAVQNLSRDDLRTAK
jgi:hypothetical protein